MLDMDGRLRPARQRSFLVLAAALVACGPWLGWWTLAPLLAAGVLFGIADKRMHTMRRPEYLMFAAWAGSEVIIAISVALTGGPKVATLSWLALPMVTLASRFSDRGITVGVLTALGLLLAVSFGVDAHAVMANPPRVIAPAALIAGVTMLSTALMRSDVEHRNRAVIDGLTGSGRRRAAARRGRARVRPHRGADDRQLRHRRFRAGRRVRVRRGLRGGGRRALRGQALRAQSGLRRIRGDPARPGLAAACG